MCTPDATSVPECVEAIVGNRKVSVHKATGRLRVSINGETVMIHRLVMETVLGRKLLPTEHVHHKDGNPLHNAPENLEILSHAEHNALHGRLREDRITATCQHCGQEFTRYRSYGKHMFCSIACRSAANSTTRTCPQCGKVFHAPNSRRQVHCSRTCAAAATHVEVPCAGCGVILKRTRGNLRYDAAYCSRDCYIKNAPNPISHITSRL